MIPGKAWKSVLAIASLGAACAMNGTSCVPRIGNNGQVCTAIAVSSVTVGLTDSSGQAVPAAMVNFRVNGGQINQTLCNGNCDSFPLAFEVTGKFDLQILALGYLTTTKSVDVPLDEAGCHPVPQKLDVTMQQDTSNAILDGAWSTSTFYGDIALRFGSGGKIVGAIFYSQRASGDGNYYIAYNGNSIKGVAGQPTFQETANEPTRNGNFFTFKVVSQGVVAGFENAAMSSDFTKLTGTISGSAVVYTRLSQIPSPLQ